MKKLTAILLTLALLLSLTACGAEGGETAAPTTEPAREDELTQLRREMADAGEVCAVAFLGWYTGGQEGLDAYLREWGYVTIWPWLAELGEEQYVAAEGEELYLILPADPETPVTVFDWVYDEAGGDWKQGDQTLYKGERGEPFLLHCNLSDIMPNTVVQVGDVAFSPAVSLMDGSVVTPQKVRDMTPLDTGSAPEELIPVEQWESAEEDLVLGCWSGAVYDERQDWYVYFEFQADGALWYGYGPAEDYGMTKYFYEGTWSRQELAREGCPKTGYVLELTLTEGDDSVPKTLAGTFYVSHEGDTLWILRADGEPLIPDCVQDGFLVTWMAGESVG